jgi:hypothetical protein
LPRGFDELRDECERSSGERRNDSVHGELPSSVKSRQHTRVKLTAPNRR